MSIHSTIDEYFKLQKEIHEHFGYNEDWKVIPLDDMRGYHWFYDQNQDGGIVVYSEEPFTKETITAGNTIYGGVIYTQRFLPKWVYVGDDLTMISMDTRVDGNKFLSIFQNNLQCIDRALIDLYKQCWSF